MIRLNRTVLVPPLLAVLTAVGASGCDRAPAGLSVPLAKADCGGHTTSSDLIRRSSPSVCIARTGTAPYVNYYVYVSGKVASFYENSPCSWPNVDSDLFPLYYRIPGTLEEIVWGEINGTVTELDATTSAGAPFSAPVYHLAPASHEAVFVGFIQGTASIANGSIRIVTAHPFTMPPPVRVADCATLPGRAPKPVP